MSVEMSAVTAHARLWKAIQKYGGRGSYPPPSANVVPGLPYAHFDPAAIEEIAATFPALSAAYLFLREARIFVVAWLHNRPNRSVKIVVAERSIEITNGTDDDFSRARSMLAELAEIDEVS
ncbi:MAG: hypothetical protein AAF225_01185 [Pseudomonadota bacterium]